MQQSKQKILSNEHIGSSATGEVNTNEDYIEISNLPNRKQLEKCIELMDEPEIRIEILGHELKGDYKVELRNFIDHVAGFNLSDVNIVTQYSEESTSYAVRAYYETEN